MKHELFLYFDGPLPRTTAQEKGEKVCYRWQRVGNTTKKVPYISHYRKPEVEAARTLYAYKLKPYRPKTPSILPIKIEVFAYFDIKDRSKWGKYKPTKPDAENWFKELADVMTQLGYWEDDNQIVDLRIVKYYAEKASIVIRWEELSDGKVNRE